MIRPLKAPLLELVKALLVLLFGATIAASGGTEATVGGGEASGNLPPEPPSVIAPADGATGVSTEATLDVLVSDPDGDPLTVTFRGRRIDPPPADFTIVALPDTQFYSRSFPDTFTAQTQWIVDTQAALKTVFVSHLGDIVQDMDYFEVQWVNADSSLSLLDGVLPYGLAIGNHDMHETGQGDFFDQYFESMRYAHLPWYGGNFRNNKNSFQLFSVGSLDFLALHLEYDVPGGVLAWADGVLKMFPNRRAILSTHIYVDGSGSRPLAPYNRPDGTSAEEVWQQIVAPNCNVFLVLNGHYGGEAQLTSMNDCGLPVHQIMQNYQTRVNGGDGWLRYFVFRPSQDRIDAFTYSPTLDLFETDADSQFSLYYEMTSGYFQMNRVVSGVPSGSSAINVWDGRSPATTYEWYATVDDGQETIQGPVWRFTTESACQSPAPDDQTCDGRDDDCDGTVDDDYTPPVSTCGLGACAANTGRLLCEAGRIVDTCNPMEGTSPDDDCDGIDDNCDGATDESWTSQPSACGVGACVATGITTCVNGEPGDTCTPGVPAIEDATCDGIDDDCDGAIDEEFPYPPTTCGVGECAGNSGQLECVLGSEVDTCNPMAGATGEVCDGADNDCDGSSDEGDPEGGHDCGEGAPGSCDFMATTCVAGELICEIGSGPAPEVAPDLVFLDLQTLHWTVAGGASSYALYRGSQGGAPWSFNHTCLQAPLAGPPAITAAEPPPDSAFYYLLSGRNACGEGALGRASSGEDRPTATLCP